MYFYSSYIDSDNGDALMVKVYLIEYNPHITASHRMAQNDNLASVLSM